MKKGTSDHPKTKTLAKILDVPLPMAVGVLQLLWEFAADYALDGGVGKFTDSHIAEACGWTGEPDALVSALADGRCQWLDRSDLFRLVVHDWADHCEDSVHNKLARSHRYFANGSIPKFSRLGRAEREESERWYKDNPTPTVRAVRTEQAQEIARGVRTDLHVASAHGEQIRAHAASAPTMPVHAMPVHAMPLPRPADAVVAQAAVNSEFPKTEAAIRRRFVTADFMLVTKVIEATARAYISVDAPKIPEPKDTDYADAVEEAAKESHGQWSAALFLKTVPAVMVSWALHGRHPPIPTGKLSLAEQAKIENRRQQAEKGIQQ